MRWLIYRILSTIWLERNSTNFENYLFYCHFGAIKEIIYLFFYFEGIEKSSKYSIKIHKFFLQLINKFKLNKIIK